MTEKDKVTINSDVKSYCFGCSKDNPHGLQMEFSARDGVAEAVFTPGQYHQSWPGMTHGGILFSMLDEAGGHAVRSGGVDCVTVKSEVRFVNPALSGAALKIVARIVKKDKRTVETESTIHREDGTLVATSTSLWYVVQNNSKSL